MAFSAFSRRLFFLGGSVTSTSGRTSPPPRPLPPRALAPAFGGMLVSSYVARWILVGGAVKRGAHVSDSKVVGARSLPGNVLFTSMLLLSPLPHQHPPFRLPVSDHQAFFFHSYKRVQFPSTHNHAPHQYTAVHGMSVDDEKEKCRSVDQEAGGARQQRPEELDHAPITPSPLLTTVSINKFVTPPKAPPQKAVVGDAMPFPVPTAVLIVRPNEHAVNEHHEGALDDTVGTPAATNPFRDVWSDTVNEGYVEMLHKICSESLAGKHCRQQGTSNKPDLSKPPCIMLHICPVFMKHVKDSSQPACSLSRSHSYENHSNVVIHVKASCKSIGKNAPCDNEACKFGHDELAARLDGFRRQSQLKRDAIEKNKKRERTANMKQEARLWPHILSHLTDESGLTVYDKARSKR
ncbi:hypothetical protein BKA63DRAFT_492706 [Paraphoma chrysanthemicola]|nr:hypothetical protein BKA63DRAFT_492706 [Paraphoma chrysanthemicola]